MSDQDQDFERCQHIKDDGEQCGMAAQINPSNGCCIWHDPEREDEAAKRRSKGGKNAARTRSGLREEDLPAGPPETAADARRWAAWTVWATASGLVDSRTAHELGYTIRAYLKAYEKVDMSDELEELKDQVAELRRDSIREA